MKKFYNKYSLIINTIVLSCIIELFGIYYTNCFPFLTSPFYPLLILSFFILIGTCFSKKSLSFYTILLCVQLFLNIGFIFLFDSNGTVFEWAMINQRNDAYGCLEVIQIHNEYLIICGLLILSYVFIHRKKEVNFNKQYMKIKLFISSFLLFLIIGIPFIYTNKTINYESKLYKNASNNYQKIGIIGNTVYELIKGKEQIDVHNLDNIDEFIYEEPIYTSDYSGISKDNNLILILVESMEWYPFDLFEEYTNVLFPNLTNFFNNSIVATNFYQKEKTDVSEALAVLGNYPTGRYINYDFYKNEYPFSLPNLIKNNNENTIINSFHANYGDFYNRYLLHQKWGFDKLYAINEMKNYGVIDTWNNKKGDRNLDSIMFDKMKEVMFPVNEKFFSYILSFTMHGFYGERENLEEYYKIIDELKLFENKNNTMDDYLKTYLAAFMDFDKAIGIMMKYLEENNLLENTTIVLFSDHNSYYNKLSNYAKNIDEKYTSELFRIPFSLYDKKVVQAYQNNTNSNLITKFTTTSDITPTILDIFGINGWKNLYFGNSMFVENIESIVYSRNYDFFVTENFVGYSINNPISMKDNLSESELQDIEQRALTHIKKLEYVDKIYYSNYFKNNKYLYIQE